MASSNTEYSQTLQHITDAKLEELSNKREIFLKRKAAALERAESLDSPLDKLRALSDGVKACFDIPVVDGHMVRDRSGHKPVETALANLDRFLKQAEFDPSISPDMLVRWRQSLLSHLDIQTLKYEYATLFAQLTVEWLSIKKNKSSDKDASMSDDFEELASSGKLESRKEWEKLVFTPVDLNADVIKDFLRDLFTSTPDAEGVIDNTKDVSKALQRLRDNIANFESSLANPSQFSIGTLGWVISGLLKSDLLTNKQRAVLRDFQNDPTVLSELADVLNMRLTALHSWSWGLEIAVEQRRQLNGSYQVYMHEDLIQAIFLQYLGVRWSVAFKGAFRDFIKTRGVWRSPRSRVSDLEKKRRQFFLGQRRDRPSVQMTKQCIYRGAYFVSQLLDHEWQERHQEEGEEEAQFGMFAAKAKHAKQTARKIVMASTTQAESNEEEDDEDMGFALFDDGHYDENAYYVDHFGRSVMSPANQMQAKQNLLLLLSADITMNKGLHGELTCFRTQYKSLSTSLPHPTILAVLSFLGVSEKWIGFFEKFLTAPLKFADEVDAAPRVRRRGTPGSHVLSEVFGESILFCLDFMVNKETNGEYLWRVNDDLWFWSRDENACLSAWHTIQRFNQAMGVSLDAAKSGSERLVKELTDSKSVSPGLPDGKIRWGMLYLSRDQGRFVINQEMVDGHIEELKRQLHDKQGSIFGWIQAWNSFASTFFTYNFGTPANCFGQEHVDMMLQTHEHIQRKVFSSDSDNIKGDRSVITYLRETIASRFGNASIPDGYFFLPIDLGGLELSSPFVNLVGLRNSVIASPDGVLDEFLEAEQDSYAIMKQRYEAADKDRLVAQNNGFRPADADEFMSLEEYTRHREVLDYGFKGQLVEVYDKLLQRPEQEPIEPEPNGPVSRAISQLEGQHNLTGIRSHWDGMTAYWRWVAQLYGLEIVERFGGFNLVDPGLLPIGLVSQFRSGKVNWRDA